MEDEIKKEIAKATGSLSKEIYQDALQPSVRVMGTALESVIELASSVLIPIDIANVYFDLVGKRNQKKLENRLIELE